MFVVGALFEEIGKAIQEDIPPVSSEVGITLLNPGLLICSRVLV